ncbi:hypothetical protein CEXT_424631 [Caerostris extrusa]|uniref:Uncharacterized protein n=1 Tax=Caerostris extrusa TaxID=172846 RepID=A0AAV4V4U7_CAEEX|nr:hypothetical protein CEXT_424631 [Caerostris extrusa]
MVLTSVKTAFSFNSLCSIVLRTYDTDIDFVINKKSFTVATPNMPPDGASDVHKSKASRKVNRKGEGDQPRIWSTS